MSEWKLWSIYRVRNGEREWAGTRSSESAEVVLASLREESRARFEVEECEKAHLYQRAVIYHEALAGRKDIDSGMAKEHIERAQALKRALRRLSARAA